MAEADRCNILLITIDSLREDFSGSLKNLFSEAIVFKNTISQAPYTTSSFASIFTSKYPSRLKHAKLVENVEGALVKGEKTLAEVLRNNGYTTCGIHSNPLLSKLFGFERGFDFFKDSLLQNDIIPQLMKVWINKLIRLFKIQAYQTAEVINKKALTWLRTNRGNPFFLWLHYMDCHGPYISKRGIKIINKVAAEKLWRKAIKNPESISEEQLKSLRLAYEEEIDYITISLKNLSEKLKAMEIWDDALVIVTADHGEEFKEHGGFTHQHKLYDELLRVPLVMKLPMSTRDRQVIGKQVALIDITPTILEYTGIDLSKFDFEGNSLLNLIEKGEDKHLGEYAFTEADFTAKYNGCIRTSQWKLIKNEVRQEEELYNLIKDPWEKVNVAANHPKIAEELRHNLETHISQTREQTLGRGEEDETVDAQVRERLRTLGYID